MTETIEALRVEARARAEACAWTELDDPEIEIDRLKTVIADIAAAQDAGHPWPSDLMLDRAAARPVRRIIHTVGGYGLGADWDLTDVLAAIDTATRIAWRQPGLPGGHELTISSPDHFGGRLFALSVTRKDAPR